MKPITPSQGNLIRLDIDDPRHRWRGISDGIDEVLGDHLPDAPSPISYGSEVQYLGNPDDWKENAEEGDGSAGDPQLFFIPPMECKEVREESRMSLSRRTPLSCSHAEDCCSITF